VEEAQDEQQQRLRQVQERRRPRRRLGLRHARDVRPPRPAGSAPTARVPLQQLRGGRLIWAKRSGVGTRRDAAQGSDILDSSSPLSFSFLPTFVYIFFCSFILFVYCFFLAAK
jgi:hypothetical protein